MRRSRDEECHGKRGDTRTAEVNENVKDDHKDMENNGHKTVKNNDGMNKKRNTDHGSKERNILLAI